MKAELLIAPKVQGKVIVKLAFLGVFLMTCVYLAVELVNAAVRLL